MPKPEWGVKRSCLSCGARFYDLLRSPVICPGCGAEVDVTALVKPKRVRPGAAEKAAVKKVRVDDEDLVDDEDGDDADSADDDDDDDEALVDETPIVIPTDDDEADADDDEAEVEVEDADDLGEFDDDVLLEDTDDDDDDDLDDVAADDIEKL